MPRHHAAIARPRRDFHTRDLGHQDKMQRVHAARVLCIDQLADLGAPRLGDIVFDHYTGVEIIDGHH